MDKPEALRLAESAHLGYRIGWQRLAAAELRRLHELLEAEQTLHQRVIYPELQRLRAQRGVLLEALRKIGQYTGEGPTYSTPWQDIVADLGQTARAAIKAVEGEKNHG